MMTAEERKFQDPDYDYYDIEDDEEEGGRGPILAFVAVIVAMAFIGVVLVAYQQGKRDGRQEMPPILRADHSPIIEAPAETASADQPKSPSAQIFSPSKPEPEVMAPPPEEPVAAKKPLTMAPPPVAPAPTKNVEVKSAPEPAPAAPVPTTTLEPAAQTPLPAAAAAPAGSYLVQIGSFKSEQEANATWDKIKGKNSDILSAFAPNIISVDLGAKGTYQRLRFGPFNSKDAAVATCNQLKARKQDCLVSKQ